MRRTVAEVVIVAALASGLVVIGAILKPAARFVQGPRQWVTSWAQPAEPATAGGAILATAFPDGHAHDQTLREVVSLSLGGPAFRVRLTNEFGDGPLVIGSAVVAPALAGGAIDAAHAHHLRFGGLPTVTIPAGVGATSDPVPAAVGSGQDLAVSFAVTGTSPSVTMHQFAGRTSGISAPLAGDLSGRADGVGFTTHTTGEFWLANVEVLNPKGLAHDVVALGDSLTDPYLLSDGELAWPEILRRQLEGSPSTAAIGILNGGITGSTVTDLGCPVCGRPIIDRVIADAVNVSGVRAAFVLGGTNDITRGASAAEIVHGLASVAAVLHAHGKRAIAMTIPPRAEGSYGWKTATMDPIRRAVNGWLRATRDFDAMVDADRLLADPTRPTRLAPGYGVPDGLHLTVDGRSLIAAATMATESQWR